MSDSVTREDWVRAIDDNPGTADRFARVFLSKADTMNLWPCVGYVRHWNHQDGNRMSKVAGGMAYSVRQSGTLANLQLLHVFSQFRKLGVGRQLCHEFRWKCLAMQVMYFRLSAEAEAVPFYRSVGFKFQGEQKEGRMLSVGRFDFHRSTKFSTDYYGMDDEVICAEVYRKGKGACTNVFSAPM